MLGRPVLQRTFVSILIAAGSCAACNAAAQPATPSIASRSSPVSRSSPATGAASPSDDMAMPDDMGAPIAAAPSTIDAPAMTPGQVQRLSVNTPIGVIASTPQGKAVLEHDLPGLCERPEYVMFRTMSPAKLAILSNGRISQAKLIRLQAHLVEVSGTTTTEPPHHSLLAEGGTRVKRFSRSVYRKVLSAIESL